MRKINFRAEFFKEGDVYVGLCPELNVSSFGDSLLESRQSLTEAVEAFLEECERMGTLEDVLEEAGFSLHDGAWFPREPVSEERLIISK